MDKVISFEEQKRIAELEYDISKLERLSEQSIDDYNKWYSLQKQIWWCRNEIQKILGE